MAMIVDAFAGKLVEKLGNVIEEKAIMVLGVKDELQKLQRRMKRIECVLKDAERRRIQQEEAVKLWVEELKDVMYDAEDIIDLCMIQGTGVLLQDDHHHTQLAESSAAAATRVYVGHEFHLCSCMSTRGMLLCFGLIPYHAFFNFQLECLKIQWSLLRCVFNSVKL